MKYHSVSWKDLHTLTYSLAEKIQKKNVKLDLIVSIARGGLVISQIASDFLKLPVASFTISSYKDLKQQKMSDISYHVGGDLKGKHILLVDDMSDTGKTFLRGINYLSDLGAISITTASPFMRQKSRCKPDYYTKQVIDEWIIFPYEMRETIEAFQINLHKEGKTEEYIRKQLIALKIPKKYIAQYLKTL